LEAALQGAFPNELHGFYSVLVNYGMARAIGRAISRAI